MKVQLGSVSADRAAEFLERGYRARTFFPHTLLYLPKCGPDGYKIAQWMCGETDPDRMWEVVVYGDAAMVDLFPRELFFDDDVVWHQQQFGRTGQVATANLVVQGRDLYSMVHLSDLVQRISRRRELKTRVENRFKGWSHMLLHAILNFARTRGLERWFVPTSDWALRHTDPDRTVGPELFRRVYDRNVHELFETEPAGPWWRIDVPRNASRLVPPRAVVEKARAQKTICVCHDVEKGAGHAAVDPAFAGRADAASDAHLERMLAIEREASVRATYDVVGLMLADVRDRIEAGGHCVAFHSFDHRLETDGNGRPAQGSDQVGRCRAVDYRIKGYRVPQSRMTPELTDENLCFHNFEWLASSAHGWGFDEPRLEKRIVKIPIHFDDFPMHQEGMPYEEWERRVLAEIEERDFTAFGLHDCYGDHWLPHYASLLEKLRARGTLRTMNEVADQVFLREASPVTA